MKLKCFHWIQIIFISAAGGACFVRPSSCLTSWPQEHLSGKYGRRGKLISKIENHTIGFEPLLIYNLGPVSWVYAKVVRPFMGKVFGAVGRMLYLILDFLHQAAQVQPYSFV